jgi:hypothetical protein
MNPKVIPIHGAQDDCILRLAIVKGVSERSLMIDFGAGVINARVAFSCLVEPIAGDSVLVNQSGNDYFVLSVLERQAEQNMALSFPADVKILARKGQIDFVADQDLNFLSTKTTNILSAKLNLTSANMNINTSKLTALATDIESHSQTVSMYSNVFNSVTKQISQKTDILIRWVEQVETLNIGNLIQNVRKNYTSHSDQAVITASKDMRIDGERIHMG